jgi:hypothetical protein
MRLLADERRCSDYTAKNLRQSTLRDAGLLMKYLPAELRERFVAEMGEVIGTAPQPKGLNDQLVFDAIQELHQACEAAAIMAATDTPQATRTAVREFRQAVAKSQTLLTEMEATLEDA